MSKKTKAKKTVVTEVRGSRIEFTAEVVPGESVRIYGRKAVSTRPTGVVVVRVNTTGYYSNWATEPFKAEAAEKLSRLSGDTHAALAGLLTQYLRSPFDQRTEVESVALLRDAFLHDADLDLAGHARYSPAGVEVPWHLRARLNLEGLEVHAETEPVWQEFDQTFAIGDTVVTGSYNLIYTARVVKITAKKVVVNGGYGDRDQHFTLEKLARLNWNLDLGDVRRHNDAEMQCI